MKWAETDDPLFIEICNGPEGKQCCEAQLDNSNKNAFKNNQVDVFEGSDLSLCQSLPITKNINNVKMRKEKENGWRGEYVIIEFSNGNEINCPINRWIDDEIDGREMTIACKPHNSKRGNLIFLTLLPEMDLQFIVLHIVLRSFKISLNFSPLLQAVVLFFNKVIKTSFQLQSQN